MAKPAARNVVSRRRPTAAKKAPRRAAARRVAPRRAPARRATAAARTMSSWSIASPWSDVPVPAPFNCGKAFPMYGLCRQYLSLGTLQKAIVAITNCGNSGTLMMQAVWTVNGSVNSTLPSCPALIAHSDRLGGPTSARAMKCGVSLSNYTQALNRGGRVMIVSSDARIKLPGLPSTMTAADWDTVFLALADHPNCRSRDGAEFGRTKHFACHVVDTQRYHDFAEYNGAATFDGFWDHIGIWTNAVISDRPMSTTFFLFEQPATNQTYNFTARGMWYTRWPLDTVPGQHHRHVPVASQGVVNAIHSALESRAGVAMETATVAGVAAKAYGMLRGGAAVAGELAGEAVPVLAAGIAV